MIKNIERSSRFKRSFKKLSESSQKKLRGKIKLFVQDPFDPRLRTHKLKPREKQYYAFSIEYDLRVVFRFEKDSVIFLDIGTHDEVY